MNGRLSRGKKDIAVLIDLIVLDKLHYCLIHIDSMVMWYSTATFPSPKMMTIVNLCPVIMSPNSHSELPKE